MESKEQGTTIYPVVQLTTKLAYIHVVEVSHKGYGISLDPLLSHTYHQGNRWRVSTKQMRVIQTSWSFHN
jgi:hypothetical protein